MVTRRREVKSQRKTLRFLPLVLLVFLPQFVLGIASDGFRVLMPLIKADFSLTRTQIGMYTSVLFFSSFLVSIIAGWLTDQIGAKRGMIIGVAVLSGFISLQFLVPSYTFLLFVALLAGLGLSVITPAAHKGVTDWTEGRKRGSAFGIIKIGVVCGGMAGAALLPRLAEATSWRTAALIPGGIGLLITVLLFLFYDDPEKKVDQSVKQRIIRVSYLRQTFKIFLINRTFLVICLAGFVLGGYHNTLITYIPLFFTESAKLSIVSAGLALSLLQFGGILGRVGWNYVGNIFFQEKPLFSLSILTTITALGCFILGFGGLRLPPWITFTVVFVLGIATVGNAGLYWTVLSEFVSSTQIGIATGISLTFITLGIIILTPLFGYIADMTGDYVCSWYLFAMIASLISGIIIWYGREGTCILLRQKL